MLCLPQPSNGRPHDRYACRLRRRRDGDPAASMELAGAGRYRHAGRAAAAPCGVPPAAARGRTHAERGGRDAGAAARHAHALRTGRAGAGADRARDSRFRDGVGARCRLRHARGDRVDRAGDIAGADRGDEAARGYLGGRQSRRAAAAHQADHAQPDRHFHHHLRDRGAGAAVDPRRARHRGDAGRLGGPRGALQWAPPRSPRSNR